jgi:hypothetical protein
MVRMKVTKQDSAKDDCSKLHDMTASYCLSYDDGQDIEEKEREGTQVPRILFFVPSSRGCVSLSIHAVKCSTSDAIQLLIYLLSTQRRLCSGIGGLRRRGNAFATTTIIGTMRTWAFECHTWNSEPTTASEVCRIARRLCTVPIQRAQLLTLRVEK